MRATRRGSSKFKVYIYTCTCTIRVNKWEFPTPQYLLRPPLPPPPNAPPLASSSSSSLSCPPRTLLVDPRDCRPEDVSSEEEVEEASGVGAIAGDAAPPRALERPFAIPPPEDEEEAEEAPDKGTDGFPRLAPPPPLIKAFKSPLSTAPPVAAAPPKNDEIDACTGAPPATRTGEENAASCCCCMRGFGAQFANSTFARSSALGNRER